MKNKKEREQFLRDYKKWHMDDCAIAYGVAYYHHNFKNGARVIVTECAVLGHDSLPLSETEPSVDVRYNLIIPEADDYNPFDANSGHTPREFLTYNLKGVGIGTIVDYMTKRRDVI